MRRAKLADVDPIKKILLVSFENDPHVNCLLEESRNERKANILIDYVVDQTLRRGQIYLSDDNNAVACGILREVKGCPSITFGGAWLSLSELE